MTRLAAKRFLTEPCSRRAGSGTLNAGSSPHGEDPYGINDIIRTASVDISSAGAAGRGGENHAQGQAGASHTGADSSFLKQQVSQLTYVAFRPALRSVLV